MTFNFVSHSMLQYTVNKLLAAIAANSGSGSTSSTGGTASCQTINKTWSQLKGMRDNGTLVAGQSYRITDYTCTTTVANTRSAGNLFDIIVTALDSSHLSEDAHAAHHDGDTYFTNCNLDAWQLKYCIDNDTDRFAWADSTNGKGVIYYMKDEFDNECPYDFKNIQFTRLRITSYSKITSLQNTYNGFTDINRTTTYPIDASTSASGSYFYTFTFFDYGWAYDLSVYQCGQTTQLCYNNAIDSYYSNNKRQLNNIVFNSTSYVNCFGNKFSKNCRDMTFGKYAENNFFDANCFGNIFGDACSYNIFGDSFSENVFGNYNTHISFGFGCSRNIVVDNCDNNKFKNLCNGNTIDGCSYNTLNNNCSNNTISGFSKYNTFEDNCNGIIFEKIFTENCIVESNNKYITLTSTKTINTANRLQNITIAHGVNNTTTRKTISHNTVNDTFRTIYQAATSVVVNV